MAGFQLSINGRFWVSTEEHGPTLVAVESQAVAHRTGNRTGRLVVEIVPQIVP